ncbi:YeiH family protein [Calditerrivibrio sp.]|uniref:Putative sulfate exporter family transporter n=1 Tax=Calditerrivibrio nitroreducens TaxID=477976 RepID=A0A2J6WRA6_9BACT|nr:MAG: putative sulfate exporter family transporter [Calditerrivibrio nitroreducens]
MQINTLKIVFIIGFLLCGLPFIESTHALILGVLLSISFGNPFPSLTAKLSKNLLKIAVVGLGFGVNFYKVIEVGKNSILLTFTTILASTLVGLLIGNLLSINKKTSLLISFGTAICGGSAIAAMAPVIEADSEQVAVSLATVFILNAIALLIFPAIGHLLNLSQTQFGLFSALAIHDTSSVVGAASVYGATALSIATTVKLTRALWIAPFAFAVGLFKGKKGKINLPLFILGFIFAAFINSSLPSYAQIWQYLNFIAKRILVMTLFLIGAGLSRKTLQEVGIRPLIQGVALWFVVSVSTLGLLYYNILNYHN